MKVVISIQENNGLELDYIMRSIPTYHDKYFLKGIINDLFLILRRTVRFNNSLLWLADDIAKPIKKIFE